MKVNEFIKVHGIEKVEMIRFGLLLLVKKFFISLTTQTTGNNHLKNK